MSRRVTVELTAPQLLAAWSALESYIGAGTYDECVIVFGSAGGVQAAERAMQALSEAGNKIGAFRV